MSVPFIVALFISFIVILIGIFLKSKNDSGYHGKLYDRVMYGTDLDIENKKSEDINGIRGQFYNNYVLKYMSDKNRISLAKAFNINTNKLDNKIKDCGLGKKITVEEILALKFIGLVGGILFIVMGLLINFNVSLIVFGVLIYAGGSILPELLINKKYKKRNQIILNQLPDFIDLIRTLVEAGMTINLAIEAVSEKMTGPLAQQFRAVTVETRTTGNWIAAMDNMAFRNDLDALNDFVSDVCIAVKNGTAIAGVLAKESEIMRTLKTSAAMGQAKSLTVKLIFPLVLLCFGPLLALILGPVVISFLKNI